MLGQSPEENPLGIEGADQSQFARRSAAALVSTSAATSSSQPQSARAAATAAFVATASGAMTETSRNGASGVARASTARDVTTVLDPRRPGW